MGYFHELRNFTQHKCGIIISGPSYFEDDINSWVESGVRGVEEFNSRISFWVKLIRPTNAEIKAVLEKQPYISNVMFMDDGFIALPVEYLREFGEARLLEEACQDLVFEDYLVRSSDKVFV